MPKSFSGPLAFLSNFFECRICLRPQSDHESYVFRNAEAAFQFLKAPPDSRLMAYGALRLANGPQARRIGRSLPLIPDWRTRRVAAMQAVIHAKFAQNPQLAVRLVENTPTVISEGNSWGDTFWGVDAATGRGENHLGRLLMAEREIQRAVLAGAPWYQRG